MKHTTFYKSLSFNKIIILDCLSDHEFQTANHLYQNLMDSGHGELIVHLKTSDADDFLHTLRAIKELCDPDITDIGFRPIIHIEAHGSKESMAFADSSTIYWEELANELRDINQVMSNELITFIGTCHGYHFIYNNHSINHFTPSYFCIAPLESIESVDVLTTAIKFYKELLESNSISQAANSLNSSIVYTFNSDFIFHNAFHETIQKYHRGKSLNDRIENLITQSISLMGDHWGKMGSEEKRDYLKKARTLLKQHLKDKESLRKEFIKFSNRFMGYANDAVFEEIWKHMQDNKQGGKY